MSRFLALSCLQGRPMGTAFEELCSLGDLGVQLTPGCQPTPGFAALVASSGRAWRTHHGFSWTRRKREVWRDGQCLVRSHSVHPPMDADPTWLERWADEAGPALEGMVPGTALGDGTTLARAMDLGIRLAIDVSHLFIQREQGALSSSTLERVFAYDRIEEVHVSHNDGKRDQHAPIRSTTFGLDWAKERARAGTPTILEAYFHGLDRDQRLQQVNLLVG